MLPQWLSERFSTALEKRKSDGALRTFKRSANQIDFSSNDYLGLARNPSIPGGGSTGSRLITGHSIQAEKLEQWFSQWMGDESSLVFNSGYTANCGIIPAVSTRHDVIVYDELVHASIRDGIALSNARSFSYSHNSIRDLRKKTEGLNGNLFFVTESVFSMDGDEAPLKDMVELAKEKNAAILLDEAHALGVIGKEGRGLSNFYGLQNDIAVKIFPLGKGAGSHGALVSGTKLLIDYLLNFSRSFVYTTALPPDDLNHIFQHLEMLPKLENERKQLQQLITLFSSDLIKYGIPYIPSRSAIHCIVIPGNEAVKKVAASLQLNGFDVRPILSPTVPAGKERIRICLHAYNTMAEVQKLSQLIKENCNG